MKQAILLAGLLFGLADAACADGEREVRGRVVDVYGKPVAGADVTPHWRANGPLNDQNGKPYNPEFIKTDEG